MEISMEVPKKTENGTTVGSSYTIFCYLSERIKWSQHIFRDTSIPMFMAAQVTITKLWNQPGYLLTDKWIKKVYKC